MAEISDCAWHRAGTQALRRWPRAAEFAGPGPGITGNDTGGIFPYSPAVEGTYPADRRTTIARAGAAWRKVTSVHRIYGDYVSFVCYDRPGGFTDPLRALALSANPRCTA